MAKDKDEVSPGKKTKETLESSEAEETIENAEKEKVNYHYWYSEFAPRALTAITYEFDGVQDVIVIYCDGVINNIQKIRYLAEYVDVLHRMYTANRRSN